MNILDVANLGIGIFSIAVLAYLVCKFLEYMKRQEENFRQTINDHLTQNANANKNLADVVKELLEYLKHKNGK